jgi:hypothetical protein
VGSIGAEPPGTGPLRARSGDPIQLFVVLEGERDGLPVYCTSGPRFRIRGRAIPQRLILSPQEAGLAEADVQWVSLHSTPGATGWTRRRIENGRRRWSLPVEQLPPYSLSTAELRSGTARYAAAVDIGGGRNASSGGWAGQPGPSPEDAPGFRVSRVIGDSLDETALSLSGLPVFAGAVQAHVRERVALRPVDLVLTGYAEIGGQPIPGDPGEPLHGLSWSWLLESVGNPIRLRKEGPAVGTDARPVSWGSEEPASLRPGDVLLPTDGAPAILRLDQGDGLLDSADAIIHTIAGDVRIGALAELGPTEVRVLRPRDFSSLREQLSRAGYGTLGGVSYYGPDLGRSLKEFQADHGLPATGIPDDATRVALTAFLDRLRSHDETIDDR